MLRLREIREAKGMSQIEAAKQLNVSRQSYNFYENGKRDPDTQTLQRMAEFFNVSVDYLIGNTDVKPLNIVMKTTACNGMDVAKISDVEGKGMCKNPEYVEYLQRCIDWRMRNEK